MSQSHDLKRSLCEEQLRNGTDTEIITVDPDIFAYSVSSSLYEQAQVRDRITMKTNYSYNVFAELKEQGRQIDILFVDHVAQDALRAPVPYGSLVNRALGSVLAALLQDAGVWGLILRRAFLC